MLTSMLGPRGLSALLSAHLNAASSSIKLAIADFCSQVCMMLQAIHKQACSSSVFSPVTCQLAEHMLQACQSALSLCSNPAGQPASPWDACAVSTRLQSCDAAAGNQVKRMPISSMLLDVMPHP